MSQSEICWHQPSHADRLTVSQGAEPFSWSAYSNIALPAGAHFAPLSVGKVVTKRTYTSVQVSETHFIELHSDLVFCNHSCQPSLIFDSTKMEVRVADNRDLRPGDALTFFYPSTEWEMVQGFECTCDADPGICLGSISGAKDMDRKALQCYFLNEHIQASLETRRSRAGSLGRTNL